MTNSKYPINKTNKTQENQQKSESRENPDRNPGSRMLPKIIFCTAVSVATLAVILLALVSPVAHRRSQKSQTKQWLALSLYIQRPHLPSPTIHTTGGGAAAAGGAFIFHHTLTEGPLNSSQVVGKAQGFVIPTEHFAHSSSNIIYLTLETPEFSGSLSIQAKNIRNKRREKLTVVGGTGSFAFARGLAILTQADERVPDFDALYHVKLRLRFPEPPRPIPG